MHLVSIKTCYLLIVYLFTLFFSHVDNIEETPDLAPDGENSNNIEETPATEETTDRDIAKIVTDNVIVPVKRTLFDRQFFIQAFSNIQYQYPSPTLIVHPSETVKCLCEACKIDVEYQTAIERDERAPQELINATQELSVSLSSDTDSEEDVVRPSRRRTPLDEPEDLEERLFRPVRNQSRRNHRRHSRREYMSFFLR